MSPLLEGILRCSPRSMAFAISLVENEQDEAASLLDELFAHTGRAHRVGITGPPGAGKSTLVDQLTRGYRQNGRKVGIIAVDPTSPFTGGALLGDRVRLQEHSRDAGVFVRSMASRGSTGGLARRTTEAADILDAAGMDLIILETVGVGQSELEVADAADTTVVVLVPESGDAVQAMKAGLLEIADLFVLNKADLAGSDQALLVLRTMLDFSKRERNGWPLEVYPTAAEKGEGVEDVAARIDEHAAYLNSNGELERRRLLRLRTRVHQLLREHLDSVFWTERRDAFFEANIQKVVDGVWSPRRLVEELLSLELH